MTTTAVIDLHAPYQERVADGLNNKHLKTALGRSTGRMSGQRVAAMGAVDGQQLRDQVRQMKEYVIANLPDLLEQLENNIQANGGQVHWARDAAEVNQIVLEIARKANVQKVIKSKSMATEEVHLNHALEAAGMKVVETDLGEYIIQLNNEPPSHIVAPVIHRRLEDIAQIMQDKLDMPPTFDPEVMCALARAKLREEFLAADMGVSGCNFAIAETGTICTVTNEGNGRMTSGMPRVYVAIVGIEKMVPTPEDAQAAYSTLDAKLQKALSVASRQAYIDIKSSGVRLEKLMRLYGILKKEIKSLGARNYTGLVMDADQYYARFTVDEYRYYVGAFSPEGSNKIVATYGKLPYSESYGDPSEKCEFHITVDIMYPSVLGTNMKDTSEVFDCATVLSGKANTAIKNIIIKVTSDALKDDKPHY